MPQYRCKLALKIAGLLKNVKTAAISNTNKGAGLRAWQAERPNPLDLTLRRLVSFRHSPQA
jgi:hypothetical protein